MVASALFSAVMCFSCCQKAGEFSVPVTLVKGVCSLSFFKDSSHTCPMRMAVRVRPLACLRYSESCLVVGGIPEVMAVFSLWRRAECIMSWSLPKGLTGGGACIGGSHRDWVTHRGQTPCISQHLFFSFLLRALENLFWEKETTLVVKL